MKLIAARNAIDHPARPLEIARPAIAGQPAAYLDPFFQPHGDHAHATTSELFPLLSAPLIAAFGIRGAYVLPGLGFLLALLAIAWLGTTLDSRCSPVLVCAVGVVCTPLLFYGLEFWEHAPAVAVAALATALVAGTPISHRRAFVAGLLFGVAILFRPEAVWYAAVVVGLREGSVTGQPPVRERSHSSLTATAFTAAAVVAGVAAALSPMMLYWWFHARQVVGPHVTGNLASVPAGWTGSRIAIASTWFGSITARESLWAVAPAVALAMAGPVGAGWRGRGFLWRVTIVDILLVLVTAPNDGGGQWGPRYLLFAFIPLTLLIADALANLSGRRTPGLAAAIGVMVLSLAAQRSAYKELRAAKTTYQRIVDFVERQSTPDGYVLTDLWWLDQVAAALYPKPTMLYVDDRSRAREALHLLSSARARDVTIVRSEAESGPERIAEWLEQSGFAVAADEHVPDRGLTAYRLKPVPSP